MPDQSVVSDLEHSFTELGLMRWAHYGWRDFGHLSRCLCEHFTIIFTIARGHLWCALQAIENLVLLTIVRKFRSGF